MGLGRAGIERRETGEEREGERAGARGGICSVELPQKVTQFVGVKEGGTNVRKSAVLWCWSLTGTMRGYHRRWRNGGVGLRVKEVIVSLYRKRRRIGVGLPENDCSIYQRRWQIGDRAGL